MHPLENPDVVAVDFETYYDSKSGYGLKTMTPYRYTHDERFDPYMVSVAWPDGRKFVGDPKKFDWEQLRGKLLVAHNAAFDGMVLNAMVERGWVPDISPEWVDTADLAAYLGVPRNLKGASLVLLGREMSKKVRSDMDGVRTKDLSPSAYEDLVAYADTDAVNCLDIWLKYSHKFPLVERRISRQNRMTSWRGVQVDVPAVVAGLEKLKLVKADAESKLPWCNMPDARDNKPAGSTQAMAMYARMVGLTPPKSFKKNDPEFMAWCAAHEKKHPWIRARLDHAGTIQHIARLTSLLELVDDQGVYRPSFLYFGAHTGRNASGTGEEESTKIINLLNLKKKPVHGVDMRGLFRAREGHKFVVFDYSQIEARISLWLSGDTMMLGLIREVGSIYMAAAIKMGWWKKEDGDLKKKNPDLYALVKALVLGLGFGMAAGRFLESTKEQGQDIGMIPKDQWPDWENDRSLGFVVANVVKLDPADPANEEFFCRFFRAYELVKAWRTSNRPVVEKWGELIELVKRACHQQVPEYSVVLPSGRIKTYFNPVMRMEAQTQIDPETKAVKNTARPVVLVKTMSEGKHTMMHGGKALENLAQSISRDIMAFASIDVEDAHPEWHYMWSVYDEIIFEVKDEDTETAMRELPALLTSGPHIAGWTAGLPVEVEGYVKERYTK